MRALVIGGGDAIDSQPSNASIAQRGPTPKALLPVGGVPLAFHQMRLFKREGVAHVTFLASRPDEAWQGVVRAEAQALGLAFEIAATPGPFDDAVFVASADTLFEMALDRMADFHRAHTATLTIAVHGSAHPRRSDIVRLNGDRIVAFMPHDVPRAQDERNRVPAGLFMASPDFFAAIPGGDFSPQKAIPAVLASGAKICGYQTAQYIRTVDTPAQHDAAERDLANGTIAAMNARHQRPAIFFDFDGVLNEEPGPQGILTPDDVVLIPGAAAALQAANAARHLTIGATNRAQIARGEVTLRGLDHIIGREETLLAQGGGIFDRVYFCPHHPGGKVPEFSIDCECRKPGTLMLRWGFADLPVDQARSCMIGDSLRDIGAAQGAGLWAYGLRTGYECRDTGRYPGAPPNPDLMFADVGEAVPFATTYGAIAQPVLTALGALDPIEGRPLLVAIAGPSRAGKSSLAHALLRSLDDQNVSALHVRLDDWMVPLAKQQPGMTAHQRNRTNLLPELIAALRDGKPVTPPGDEAPSLEALSLDAGVQRAATAAAYDPEGHAVILLDGLFALDEASRALIDLGVYIENDSDTALARFRAYYGWTGLADDTIDEMWRARQIDEWPLVTAQREYADVVLAPER